MNTELLNMVFPAFTALVVFYLFYMLLLRKDNHFLLNRIYILVSLLFSFAIPFIHFTIMVPSSASIEILPMSATVPEMTGEELMTNPNNFFQTILGFFLSMAFSEILSVVYLGGVALFSGLLLVKFIRLILLIHHSPKEKRAGYVLVRTDKNICPVSFFKYIVINENYYTEAETESIILHEQLHIKQWHSIDVILMEFAIVLQWFNPIIRLYRKELRNVHEYMADEGVLRGGIIFSDYLRLLFQQTTGIQFVTLGNNFSQCLTSKRIKMMKNSKKSTWTAAKMVLAMPIAVLLMAVFCMTTSCENNTPANDAEGTIDTVKEAVTEAVAETAPISDSVYTMVDEMPEFPGGQNELMKFLSENLNYPEAAKKGKIQGTVYVSFIVENDGTVSNATILRGIGGGCDEEALRVVNMMPKWKAGKSKGAPVRVTFNLPIRFTL